MLCSQSANSHSMLGASDPSAALELGKKPEVWDPGGEVRHQRRGALQTVAKDLLLALEAPN